MSMPPPMNMDSPILEKTRALKRIAHLFASLPSKGPKGRKAMIKQTLQGKWHFFGIGQKEENEVLSLVLN